MRRMKIFTIISLITISFFLCTNVNTYAQLPIPMANTQIENLVSYELIEDLAIKKAQQLWGQTALGQVIPCCDHNGDIVAYMFPFCLGTTLYPDYDEILKRLQELKKIGFPILIGASRKTFIGNICGGNEQLSIEDRLEGSLAAACIAILNGADIVRVHDVKETRRCVNLIDCIIRETK